jgi:hypothetical protein
MSANASDVARLRAAPRAAVGALPARRAERRAWIALSLAFLVWCALISGVLLAANNYRRYATDSPPATLWVDRGTVLYGGPAAAAQIRAQPGMSLEEGGGLEVQENGRATLDLFDGTRVSLLPRTRLDLATVRVGRFNADHTRLSLKLLEGGANLAVAGNLPFGREVTVATPHGVVALTKGDYLIWVDAEGTRVSSYTGRAKAWVEADQTVQLRDGQRTFIRPDGSISRAQPLAENILPGGDFARDLEGWTMLDRREEGKREEGRSDVGGTRQLVEETIAGRKVKALRISRETTRDTWNETGISQEINRDVSAYRTVSFTAWVKIDHASLSGGGYRGTEYPVMFRVGYIAENGGRPGWSHGFYYANPESRPTTGGELIAQGSWFPYLGRLSDLDERPARITTIEVLSAGHDFDATVADIRLVVE